MEKTTKKTVSPLGEANPTVRNPSSSYTIKQLKGAIQKMEQLKMATPEELKVLKEVHKAVVNRWIGGELNI